MFFQLNCALSGNGFFCDQTFQCVIRGLRGLRVKLSGRPLQRISGSHFCRLCFLWQTGMIRVAWQHVPNHQEAKILEHDPRSPIQNIFLKSIPGKNLSFAFASTISDIPWEVQWRWQTLTQMIWECRTSLSFSCKPEVKTSRLPRQKEKAPPPLISFQYNGLWWR